MLPVDLGCIFQSGMGTYTELPAPLCRSGTDGRKVGRYLDWSTSLCLFKNTVLLEIVNVKPATVKEGFSFSLILYFRLQVLLA